jgi:hypothetical protein
MPLPYFSSLLPHRRPTTECISRFWDNSLGHHHRHPEYVRSPTHRTPGSVGLSPSPCVRHRASSPPFPPLRPTSVTSQSELRELVPLESFLGVITQSRPYKGLPTQQHHRHRSLVLGRPFSSTEQRANKSTYNFHPTERTGASGSGITHSSDETW